MTEFTKGKVSDIPETERQRRPGSGLSQAIRLARMVVGTQICSTRRDPAKDGIWVFLRRNGGSA